MNHTTNDRFIDVYRPNGEMDRTLKQILPRPSRIAVDHLDGSIFVYDAKENRISSLDLVNGQTFVKVQNVSYVQHLFFWNGRLVWTESHRRGFFSTSGLHWNVNHVRFVLCFVSFRMK